MDKPLIFKQIPPIGIDSNLYLSGLFPKHLEIESKGFLYNSSDESIKQHLPWIYCENIIDAENKIKGFVNGFLQQMCILYCIRLIESKGPIGYILLSAPKEGAFGGKWTIDFWLNPKLRRKGVMEVALTKILEYMEVNGIDIIHVQVGEKNMPAINLLEKLGFLDVSYAFKSHDNGFKLYGIQLN